VRCGCGALDLRRQVHDSLSALREWALRSEDRLYDRDDSGWWLLSCVVEQAAAHHLMIDFHGAYKPDGLPAPAQPGHARGRDGKEYLKVTARTSPSTTPRCLHAHAGRPMITRRRIRQQQPRQFCGAQLHAHGLGTRAHELALYVVWRVLHDGVRLSGALRGAKALILSSRFPPPGRGAWARRPPWKTSLARRSGRLVRWLADQLGGAHRQGAARFLGDGNT